MSTLHWEGRACRPRIPISRHTSERNGDIRPFIKNSSWTQSRNLGRMMRPLSRGRDEHSARTGRRGAARVAATTRAARAPFFAGIDQPWFCLSGVLIGWSVFTSRLPTNA